MQTILSIVLCSALLMVGSLADAGLNKLARSSAWQTPMLQMSLASNEIVDCGKCCHTFHIIWN